MISGLEKGVKSCIAPLSVHGIFENRAQPRFCYSIFQKIVHSLDFVTPSICRQP